MFHEFFEKGVNEVMARNLVVLMTFIDANPSATAGDFSITAGSLNWGGTLAGTAPTLSIAANGAADATFSYWKVVADTVTYAEKGTHNVALGVTDAERFSLEMTALAEAALAVAWTLSQPAITAPIIGASRPEQLDATLAALDTPLPADVLTRLDELTRDYRRGDSDR